MANKEDIALKLDTARRELHEQIENAVRRYANGGESIAIDLGLVETPDSGSERAQEEHPRLYGEIISLIENFMLRPEVQESGMTIYKVQAVDSDGDGSVAVNIQFEYRDDTGMQGESRDAVGGTG